MFETVKRKILKKIEPPQPERLRQRLHCQCHQEADHQRQQEGIQHLRRDVERYKIRHEPNKDSGTDNAGRIDAIEPFRLERPVFQGTPVASDLTHPPGQRQRAHDGGHQGGAEYAYAEDQASHSLSKKWRQRIADLADTA